MVSRERLTSPPFIVAYIIVPITAALLIIFIPRLFTEERRPQVSNILPSLEVTAGKSLDVQGRNFDLVSAVLLSRGIDPPIVPTFKLQDGGELLTVTIPP